MTITAGVDLGTGTIKTVLFNIEDNDTGTGNIEWLARRSDRIRQRDPFELAEKGYDSVLADAGLTRDDVQYVATTGDGETIPFRTGHFYSMTTHARGAIYLDPEATSVLDIGALHGRAVKMDERGKVLDYRIAQDEIGSLSQQADDPEVVSSICAVLAETDVINMVSRGISASNILKGIHLSMAGRLAKLLRVIKVKEGITLATGGLALDDGLMAALNESMAKQKLTITARTSTTGSFGKSFLRRNHYGFINLRELRSMRCMHSGMPQRGRCFALHGMCRRTR